MTQVSSRTPRPPSAAFLARCKLVYDALATYTAMNGLSPTQGDLSGATGVSVTNVRRCLVYLIANGYVGYILPAGTMGSHIRNLKIEKPYGGG